MRRLTNRPFLMAFTDDGGAGGGGTPPAPTPGGGGDEGRTFTQADVDRIVTGRLAKFADYDAIKAQADGAKAAQETAVAAAVEQAKKDAAAEVIAQVTPALVNAEIRSRAAAAGFRDPMDALSVYGDTAGIAIGDGYAVDTTGITERLQAIAQEKPYLLAPKGPNMGDFEKNGGLGNGGPQDPLAGKTRTELLSAALEPKKN